MVKNAKSFEVLLAEYDGDTAVLRREFEAFLTKQKPVLKVPTRPSGPELVVIRELSKEYKTGRSNVTALKSVNVTIHQGEFVALIGPSGSGKSTLLNLIAGLDKASSGSIAVDGIQLTEFNQKQLAEYRNSKLGFVFQFFYLQPFLNLKQNIEIPAMFGKISSSERGEKAALLADSVGLGDRLEHLPKELSGGQMQRAAIARSLINGPALILADEPTGNLDSVNAQAIMDMFEHVRKEKNTTIIIVTHDREIAARADRIIELKDGALL
jgi:ABC-type lipoprotein export system ATPase subunit